MRACDLLERAEFDFTDTVVRYWAGTVSVAELGAAGKRLRQLIARIRHDEAVRQLFAFPRRLSAAASGH